MACFLSQQIMCAALLIVAAASDAAATEKPTIIDASSAPAAPPESVEARIALRQHRESTALNRYTFPGNVLQGTGDLVDHWIVMFCPGWHDKCQGLMPSYELLGVQWENKLNKDVMSSSVRFTKVDCATEKALCVSLDIDDYPSVVHYRNQQRVASWHGGAPGLVRFVKQELEGPKRRPSQKTSASRVKKQPVCGGDVTFPGDAPATTEEYGLSGAVRLGASPWRTLCFALVLLAAARGAWVASGSARLAHVSGKQTPLSASEPCTARVHPRVAASAGLEACLPREWAIERQPIEL